LVATCPAIFLNSAETSKERTDIHPHEPEETSPPLFFVFHKVLVQKQQRQKRKVFISLIEIIEEQIQ